MPRNISFALTPDQIERRVKTVTRRTGWKFLKPGDVLQGVNKTMGFKKGEKPKKLCLIRVVNVRREPLDAITKEDVVREGFPDWTPEDFIVFLEMKTGALPSDIVTRIEFEYLD